MSVSFSSTRYTFSYLLYIIIIIVGTVGTYVNLLIRLTEAEICTENTFLNISSLRIIPRTRAGMPQQEESAYSFSFGNLFQTICISHEFPFYKIEIKNWKLWHLDNYY